MSPGDRGTVLLSPCVDLFTYCGNNPISRSDEGGQFWDTVLDVASLAFSIVDVAMNPDDPWAWIGLAGDVIDLIPFVTCVGEVAKSVRAGVKVADAVWDVTKVADDVHDAGKWFDNSTEIIDEGFDTFNQFKQAMGPAGDDFEWHHIVEQCQIEKSGFGPRMIHNPNNMVPIPKATHRKISGYYSSKLDFTDGLTVRNWLAGQSFEKQYQFGLDVIQMFK